MATYKGVKGFTIQSLSADPPAPIVGQVWYNTTSTVLKGYVSGAGAWSSGNNMITPCDNGGYLGIQTAAMYFGGRGGPPSGMITAITTSETYNGTSWTETADLPTRIYQNAGFGTTTAGASRGGFNEANTPTTNTFEYNGTSWSAVNAAVNSSRNIHGTGTQTSGLVAGGSPGPYSSKSETYDGTSWSETNGLIAARWGLPLVGTSTAALGVGGTGAPDVGTTTVQEWDGTCWSTNAAALNEGKTSSAAAGTTTLALNYGGYGGGGSTSVTGATESFNGTSWAAVGSLATARSTIMGGQASPNSVAVAFGGAPNPASPAATGATEEYNDPVLSVKTFTAS